MRMTPLDVQSHHFGRRWHGYDPDEVDAFLRIVSEDYEGLVRETDSQADRIRRLESRIEEPQELESFAVDGYSFQPKLSTDERLLFARQKPAA